nr:RNA-directed DNA polymerase, eukaryota, reverse transcriptase zinc-binding domain protein [Tanacetum cinerariifolium]
MSLNIQALGQKAKKDWIRELCVKHRVNILALQETKMENMEVFTVKSCWGNFAFEFVHSDSVGNSGGILCTWDPNCLRKRSSTVSDYFVIVRGVWLKTNIDILLVVVYAPHDRREKWMLWDYLSMVVNNWEGEVIKRGKKRGKRLQSDRFGSVFHARDAEVFNSFILNAGLVEVSLGDSAYTWWHKSAKKMSKLDRFLISKNMWNSYPNISAITLDQVEGFRKFVVDTWCSAPGDNRNDMRNLMKKLKFLKIKIIKWNFGNISSSRVEMKHLQEELNRLDTEIESGKGTDVIISKRMEVINSMHNINKTHAIESLQKAKIKWSVEGDENSHFFHGVLNKRRKQMSIMGGHEGRCMEELESDVTRKEIKRAVWDCGVDKSPGPDGFTFGFYRQFWDLVEKDVISAVNYFFEHGEFS